MKIDIGDVLILVAFLSYVGGLGLYDYRLGMIGGGAMVLIILCFRPMVRP